MKRHIQGVIAVVFFLGFFLLGAKSVEAATRIHYIGLKGTTDAILLESDGHFGLVDSGEDWDYPKGAQALYPLRSNIVKNQGFEQQVIYYMKSVGVNTRNLDFYIGTHAHSDHIGSGDEIVSCFKPKKLYLKKYSDKNITNRKNLWDNLYVYNNLLEMAKKKGVTCIQEIKEGTKITLGQMTLRLYNTAVRKKIDDENQNSIIVKVSAYGSTTLLTADMTPNVARTLISQGKIGKTDILKIPHHGYAYNNPSDILRVFSPRTAIITGPNGNLSSASRQALASVGSVLYSTNINTAAVVTTYSYAGASTANRNVSAGWLKHQGTWYYMDIYGRPATGWQYINNNWYYFDVRGRMKTGWLTHNKQVYYLAPLGTKGYKEGAMVSGRKVIGADTYYFRAKSGEMLTGWRTIGGKQFYFKKTGKAGVKGRMLTGAQNIGKKTFFFKTTGGVGTKGKMLTGWQKDNGNYYYLRKTGKAGTKGAALTGWQTINKQIFYFQTSGSSGQRGKAATGFCSISGKVFYFNPTGGAGTCGKIMSGWVDSGNKFYYLKTSGGAGTKGQVQTGWLTLSGQTYYLKTSGSAGDIGQALTGWQKIGSTTYYLQETGAAGARGKRLSGWQTVKGYQYYLNADGSLVDVQANTADAGGKYSGWISMSQYNTVDKSDKPIYGFGLHTVSPCATGDITYQAYSSENGWSGEAKNSAVAGGGKVTKAIRIKLTGNMAGQMDIYYRVYLIGRGWLDWAKNGADAGTNMNYPIGAIQVQLYKKGAVTNLKTSTPFLQETVNKTTLQTLVDQVKTEQASDYTTQSWGPFKTALDNAIRLLGTVCTQSEADNALRALQTAYDQLELVESVESLGRQGESTPDPEVSDEPEADVEETPPSEPGVTEEPEVSDEPEVTEEPEVSDEPMNTAPEISQAPKADQNPEAVEE